MATIRENAWPQPIPASHDGPRRLQRDEQVVIFDIDNCLSDDGWRQKFIDHSASGDAKYEAYHQQCWADRPSASNVCVMLEELYRGHELFFVTARPEKYRQQTLWWLHNLPIISRRYPAAMLNERLLMRGDGDHRPTVAVKRAELRRIRETGRHIVRAYDDRIDVIVMYRNEGVEAIHMYINILPDCERRPDLGDGGAFVPEDRAESVSAIIQEQIAVNNAAIAAAMSDDQWPVQGARPVRGGGGAAPAQKAMAGGYNDDESPFDDLPVPAAIKRALNTFETRNKQYGANFHTFGESFLSIFPGGILPAITTVEDANRLQVLIQMHNKMMRYASNLTKGGHKDSAHDLIVYAAMLEGFTK